MVDCALDPPREAGRAVVEVDDKGKNPSTDCDAPDRVADQADELDLVRSRRRCIFDVDQLCLERSRCIAAIEEALLTLRDTATTSPASRSIGPKLVSPIGPTNICPWLMSSTLNPLVIADLENGGVCSHHAAELSRT